MNQRYLVLSYFNDKKTLELKVDDAYELDYWIYNNFTSSSKIKEEYNLEIKQFIKENNLSDYKGDITILSYDENIGTPIRHKVIYEEVLNKVVNQMDFTLFKEICSCFFKCTSYEIKEYARTYKMYKNKNGYTTSMKQLVKHMLLHRLKEKNTFEIIRQLYNKENNLENIISSELENKDLFPDPNKGIRVDSYIIDDLKERRIIDSSINVYEDGNKPFMEEQMIFEGYNKQQRCSSDEIDYDEIKKIFHRR